jgi:hypothetical protein
MVRDTCDWQARWIHAPDHTIQRVGRIDSFVWLFGLYTHERPAAHERQEIPLAEGKAIDRRQREGCRQQRDAADGNCRRRYFDKTG